jgi:hypothetical protein
LITGVEEVALPPEREELLRFYLLEIVRVARGNG